MASLRKVESSLSTNFPHSNTGLGWHVDLQILVLVSSIFYVILIRFLKNSLNYSRNPISYNPLEIMKWRPSMASTKCMIGKEHKIEPGYTHFQLKLQSEKSKKREALSPGGQGFPRNSSR